MLTYQRDLPADSPDEAIEETKAHVREHLASIADADDDPSTHAGQVRVWMARHPDDPSMIRVEGQLDAEPDAPYLKGDYDPWAGVDPELRSAVLGDG